MIYSTQHNKNTNEDPKTSTVFGSIMLLPDDIFWNILKTAASSNKGRLPEEAGYLYDNYAFWPKWDSNSIYDTGNSYFVEPDVFFRFEKIDVIVEAKYSDSFGQNREEWDREFKAYLNKYEAERKKVVLLAVGGNSTFEPEPDLIVGKHRCPIVKYSWEKKLDAVLAFEKQQLQKYEENQKSSLKRIIKNIEIGFQNNGIYKYSKKVELKGLSSIYALGIVFKKAINRETDYYTLTPYREDVNSEHYGFQFKVTPKDGRKKPIWLSIALWINDQEVISVEARNDNWADRLCKLIEAEKKFSSKYAKDPESWGNNYYFDAKEKFYKEFNEAETSEGQVIVVSKLIDDVCLYYLK